MLKDEPTVRANMESRVVALESNYETLSDELIRLDASITDQAGRIDRFREQVSRELTAINQSIASAGKANWPVLLQGAIFILMLFGMGLTPLWVSLNYQKSAIDQSMPREVITAKLVEVETQFRGVSKEIQTQVDGNKAIGEAIRRDLDELKTRVNVAEKQAAENNTRLDDHDRYIWPAIIGTSPAFKPRVQVGENVDNTEHKK